MKRGPYISRIALTRPIEGDRYLLDIPAVRYLAEGGALELRRPVTFLVGENGTGKSTLLEAVAAAWGFNPEGGTRNFRFSTEATHSALWKSLTLTRRGFARDGFFLRAESLYNVATNIDEMDRAPSLGGRVIDSYGGVSLHRQSHGESFLALVENRFGGEGLYLLDEPEAALSPTDLLYAKFADEFERRYVSQGTDENRSIFETLDLGWDLLSILPTSELKRIRPEFIAKYMTKKEQGGV